MLEYLNNVRIFGISVGLVASIVFWAVVTAAILTATYAVVRRAVRDGILAADAARSQRTDRS